jgi:membrane protein YdbS with pleckstrin-like domain
VSALGPHAPAFLHRYLLPSEEVIVAVRRHPARLVEPVGSAVAGLWAAYWLNTVLTGDVPVLADLVWLGWAALVVRALWRLAEWSRDWFVATDQRLVLTYGLFTRKVAMMPLRKVTDLSYNRSPLGRLIGYGEFVLESAGQDQALRSVPWLPSPDVLYQRICRQMFGPRPIVDSARTHTASRLSAVRHRRAAVDRTHDTEEVVGWTPDQPTPRPYRPDSGLPDGTDRPPPRWRRWR